MFKIAISLLWGVSLVGNHTQKGTEYGDRAAKKYAESNHGPDGALFLDPYFRWIIEDLQDKRVLDAGCGSAPWSIYAALHGGEVYALDIQEKMLEIATQAVESANLENRITLIKEDVASIPFKENFFDRAISICVACNLPLEGVEKHFLELQRTLKIDGVVAVGIPNSLGVIFSDGSRISREVYEHIQQVLSKLPSNPRSEDITDRLLELEEVLSATFYLENGRLTLLESLDLLEEGSAIWRKLPKLIVPNRYYSLGHYTNKIKQAGFEIIREEYPHFQSIEEWKFYNKHCPIEARLGKEYITDAPFAILILQKQAHHSMHDDQILPFLY